MRGWLAAALPGGVSAGCACRDFADATGDPGRSISFSAASGDPAALRNRSILAQRLGLARPPRWLTQVHGTHVSRSDSDVIADAAISDGSPLAILTADCLPILLARDDGHEIAAIHAGWRGLAAGVIEATIKALSASGERYHAWIGPAIGIDAFEIGPEVREALLDADREAIDAFKPGREDRWHADLAALARRRLAARGLHVSGGDWCTYSEPSRFHSFRRDGAMSGRMASVIWTLESEQRRRMTPRH